MRTVLHLTPHLGGGVGKALSGFILEAIRQGSDFVHEVICLETPNQMQFVDRIIAGGGNVSFGLTIDQIRNKVRAADLVQLEWWNHPATFRVLTTLADVPMRLLVWCHVSGMSTPVIPPGLMQHAVRFAFTSPCSRTLPEVEDIARESAEKFAVVSSSGGFEGFPMIDLLPEEGVKAGYLGSLNFSKLHPDYARFIAAVPIPDFSVKMIGDPVSREQLEHDAADLGKPDLFRFVGYTTNVVSELRAINVLAYLLNPDHYGTTENALIEAMAMGIVPVVYDNPAEREIIANGTTGLVVRSVSEFAEAVKWLHENPLERVKMGQEAARQIRDRFSVSKSCSAMASLYAEMMTLPKTSVPFVDILGATPADWFLLCQTDKLRYRDDGSVSAAIGSTHYDLEPTKGSLVHFANAFPEDERLAKWRQSIEGAA